MQRWFVFGGIGLVLMGCGGGPAGGPPADFPVTVDLAPVRIETVLETVPTVGSLEPDEVVELSPQVAGVVEGIHFEEGQRVKAGARLVTFQSGKQEARVREVEAAVALARQNFARAKALLEDNTVSKEEYDRAAAQLAADEALLALERERLKDMIVEAPFDGVLSRRRVSVGQFVNVGNPLVTLLAVDRLKLAFTVPERFAGRLAEGQAVELMVTPHPGRTFRGEITFVDPRIDPGTRTVSALAVVDNREGVLKPGLFANVRVVLGERAGALTIPEEAVFLVGDESTVYVAAEGKATARTIREGVRLAGRVEVLEGLSPSDRVILGDSRKLGEGTRLNVRREGEGEVPAVASGVVPGALR